MKKFIVSATLLVAVLLTGNIAFAEGDFISAKDASAKINSKKAVVISARSEKDYQRSHVMNAINIQHKDLYKSGAVEGVLKSPEDLAAFLSSKGVPSDKMIIIYDDGKNKYAGRLYWIFKYLGVQDVKILHKDMDEWKKARIRITGAPTRTGKANFVAKPQDNLIASTDYVKSNMNNIVLVDVRKPEEYSGTSTKPKSDGHIPGAVNLNYETLLNANGSVKSKAELEKLTSAAGLNPSKEVVLYCQTSVRAGIVFNILKTVLGYNDVKVYEGAYNEWVVNNSLEK